MLAEIKFLFMKVITDKGVEEDLISSFVWAVVSTPLSDNSAKSK